MKNLLILCVAAAGLTGGATARAEAAAPAATLPAVAHINETTVVVRRHHRHFRTVRKVTYRHGRRIVTYRRVYY